LVPLLGGPQVSLTVAKIANVGLGIASIMFPQVPQIPDSVLEAGDAILSALDHKSSAEDFACIQGTLDGESADGKTFQQQVGWAGAQALNIGLVLSLA
jgi:hypothetical protein